MYRGYRSIAPKRHMNVTAANGLRCFKCDTAGAREEIVFSCMPQSRTSGNPFGVGSVDSSVSGRPTCLATRALCRRPDTQSIHGLKAATYGIRYYRRTNVVWSIFSSYHLHPNGSSHERRSPSARPTTAGGGEAFLQLARVSDRY